MECRSQLCSRGRTVICHFILIKVQSKVLVVYPRDTLLVVAMRIFILVGVINYIVVHKLSSCGLGGLIGHFAHLLLSWSRFGVVFCFILGSVADGYLHQG